MPIVVQPDRVMIKSEFVPRSLTAPRIKAVAAGETFEPTADSTFDYIEIAGTLKVSRAHDTSLKFQTLIVLPGGTFDAGTAADPIPAAVKVEIVVLSVPIDTAKDPAQWGNGLLNFGHRFEYGAKKLEWTTLTAEVHKGDTTIALAEDPAGWAIGDEILVPETDAPAFQTAPRREAPAFVTAISGRTVTFSPALGFDHLAQRDPDGNVVLLPRVANLTRNVVIRSENTTGVPGHVADVGHGAMWNVYYTAASGLGRTRAERLDSTIADPAHIGTNQVGRYNEHHHHAMGLGSASVGNVYRGGGPKTAKWAMSVHGTHDALIERNVAIDFLGAGFVTEDGYEVRNVFRQNFGAYNVNPAMLTANPDVARPNVESVNAPGIEGTCGWFRGTMNTFDRNECWANGTGINLFNVATIAGAFPSAPGLPNDVTFDPRQYNALPVLVTGNVTASNVKAGFESWGQNKYPNINGVSSYNGAEQFFFVISFPTKPYLVNPIANGKGGTSLCIGVSSSYTETLDIEGGRITGCAVGIADGGAMQSVKVTGTFFQNVFDVDGSNSAVVEIYADQRHKPMPGHAPQYLVHGHARDLWSGPPVPIASLGPSAARAYTHQRGGRISLLKNWQGTGKDYRLINRAQLATQPAWPAGAALFQFASPEANLTMGQTWAKYGQAWGGEAVDVAKTVALEGIVAPGLVMEGATVAYGPPRAVLTYPNNYTETVVSTNGAGTPYLELYGLMTGDPATASQDFLLSVDGGATMTITFSPDSSGDQRQVAILTGLATGPHTVKTWRTTPAGAMIAASVLTFAYGVGTVVPPPPTTVTVPNVVGLLAPAAGTAITAANLIVGTVTTANSATVAAGQVISQQPAAGLTVALNSSVSLVVSAGPVVTPPSSVQTIFNLQITCNPTLPPPTCTLVVK